MFLFEEIFLVINGRLIVDFIRNSLFLIQNVIKIFRVGPKLQETNNYFLGLIRPLDLP